MPNTPALLTALLDAVMDTPAEQLSTTEVMLCQALVCSLEEHFACWQFPWPQALAERRLELEIQLHRREMR